MPQKILSVFNAKFGGCWYDDLWWKLFLCTKPNLFSAVVFDHCRSSSWNPWIGSHDANDNDVYVWLNGNILPYDDENWWEGCIFLIVVIIFKGLYYIIRDFRPGPYSARSVNFVLNKTVLLCDHKSRESLGQRLAVLDDAYKLQILRAQIL